MTRPSGATYLLCAFLLHYNLVNVRWLKSRGLLRQNPKNNGRLLKKTKSKRALRRRLRGFKRRPHQRVVIHARRSSASSVRDRRILTLTRRPTREEFSTIAKVAAIGIVIIGVAGFLIFWPWCKHPHVLRCHQRDEYNGNSYPQHRGERLAAGY